MKILFLAFIVLLLAGCVTKDFKVVDALSVGMTSEQAEETIATFGFTREQTLSRPANGWPVTDESFTNLPGNANRVEKEKGIIVEQVDYYPVWHGFLGFGQLFLFFDNDGKLIEFYRRQIN